MNAHLILICRSCRDRQTFCVDKRYQKQQERTLSIGFSLDSLPNDQRLSRLWKPRASPSITHDKPYESGPASIIAPTLYVIALAAEIIAE